MIGKRVASSFASMTQMRRSARPASSMPLRIGAVRVRTALRVRWVAVCGQAAAVLVTEFGIGFHLPLSNCLAVVLASALLNFAIWLRWRGADWLSARDTALHLAFDVMQTSALLYLTGGLLNPFALVLVAHVAVAAMILSRRSAMTLTALVFVSASVLAVWHDPLPWETSAEPVPTLFIMGSWLALVISIGFIAAYVGRVASDARAMADALATTQMVVAREQQMSSLGALAAATAHELGSPLSTIMLVANELARDVPPDSALRDDVNLLVSESERCARILARLSINPESTRDSGPGPYDAPPITALINELLLEIGETPVKMSIIALALDDSEEPQALRRPELMRGVASYLRNASQFAASKVEIGVEWSERHVSVLIDDDGPGFAPGIVAKLGEPYVSSRPGVEGHMGLGVFIAETLLGRIGASVAYSRAPIGGARVVIEASRIDFTGQGVTISQH
jgi:two-component system sensor histidine kinase RegB